MALSKPKLLQTLLLLALLLMLANKAHSQYDVSFSYDYFTSRTPNLTFQGDTYVSSGSTFLRLTKPDSSGEPRRNIIGRVVYSPPIQFWEPGRQSSFNTTIKFFITPVNNNPADGIAFFVGQVGYPIPVGSYGDGLGIFGPSGTASSICAIEFDSYNNDQVDPGHHHIGININSGRSVNLTRFHNLIRQLVTAKISYDVETKRISVVATAGSRTGSVSYTYDLKSILPQRVQVGISAATGTEVAFHDILAWYFSSTMELDRNDIDGENYEDESARIQQ